MYALPIEVEPPYKVILDSIADGVFTVDLDFRITSFNRAAEGITGISGRRAVGKTCQGVLQASFCENGCLLRKAIDSGLREVTVMTKGPGSGKETAVRTIANLSLKVKQIKDVTPVPHNGCRPRGRRRV